jgi:signal transduction histidine kinase
MPSMNQRTRLVYGALIAVWAIIIVWQVVEHSRVQQAAKVVLINRAKDISSTVGLVMRSQRRFGVISKDRIESALNALIRQGEVPAIALLNAAGDVVASAGASIDFETKGLVPTGVHWGERTVTLMNLVDLGTNVTAEAEGPRPTLVLPRSEMFNPFGTNRSGTNRPPGPPPPPPDRGPDSFRGPAPPPPDSNSELAATNSPTGTNSAEREHSRPRQRFGRPPWMTEEEYKTAIQKQGAHSFAIVLSTQPMLGASRHDLWLRLLISGLASVSVVGLGLAWRTLSRTSELELRLVRAAELNTRLKEMNLAAAGLAHETKNPLNIIRGLAQMISKQDDARPEIRQKSRSIVDEADRVTAQLNEFINFSRPREIRRSAVGLNSVVGEVVRALTHDLEEKAIRLHVQADLPAIEADEQQLRQALFNLLLNAVQAVGNNGEIQVAVVKQNSAGAALEIRDNGIGVPPEHRLDVFKPYFTTNEKGTGLGLSVVQQIVLAHGWEIECRANEPRGALFRISHLRLVSGA